eukprot:scaffold3873_cov214-Pinguiococcus_pyrenoidosus.AAC.3
MLGELELGSRHANFEQLNSKLCSGAKAARHGTTTARFRSPQVRKYSKNLKCGAKNDTFYVSLTDALLKREKEREEE